MEHPEITKEMAWAPVEGEKRIHLDLKKFPFQFTRRWFKIRNLTTWSTFFTQKYSSNQPINMIQIGVFEGMDLIWCLQNILGHPDSRVLAVDPWDATTKLDQSQMDECHGRAQHNLRPWRNKIKLVRGYSQDILPELIRTPVEVHGKTIKAGEWDLIVIDGDHNAPAVLKDAQFSYELARIGAWMVFDDYHNNQTKKNHVQKGFNKFLDGYGDDVRLAWYHRFCVCLERTT